MNATRIERLSLLVLMFILVGLPLGILSYEHFIRPQMAAIPVIDILAASPERGGFQPEVIRLETGEAVTLRFHSEDVVHGIAFGPGLSFDLGQVDPGKTLATTLTFEQSGTYTFYCNTWCGPDHWRMRGVIEVIDPDNPVRVEEARPDPIIEQLIAEGVDIDMLPETDSIDVPDLLREGYTPSYERGRVQGEFGFVLPEELEDLTWRLRHSPQDALLLLEGTHPSESREDLMDITIYLWSRAEVSEETIKLYEQNCAPCHGQSGGGDGPAADSTAERPAALSDVEYLFMKRGDVLYAKIRRGGMGTDMPNFGTLFTREQTLSLVDYLWWLGFRGKRER